MDFVPSEDLKSYELLFAQYSNDSRIDASAVQSLLAQSGLPNQVLGSIWNLSIQNGAAISFPEFSLAMFLAKSVLNGAELPAILPPTIRSQLRTALARSSKQTSNESASFITASTPLNSHRSLNDSKIYPSVRDWAVLADEKERYDQIFKSSDAGSLGYISGDSARKIFSQSGLRENMLAHIWSLCDMQNRGKLNSDEFAVAMHLVYKKLNGFDLPQTLPDNLIPPSQRSLSSLSNFAKLDAIQQQPQKRISPSSSLLSISSVAATHVRPEPNNDPVSEERERDIILKQVEEMILGVSKSKEASEMIKMRLVAAEKELQESSHRSLEAAKELSQHEPKGGRSFVYDSLSSLERTSFQKLEVDIPAYIINCRNLCLERAEKSVEKINDTHSTTCTQKDVLVNKAAALLAERMAALGVKSTLSGPGKPAESPSSTLKHDKKMLLLQIEQEKLTILSKVNDIESRFTRLSSILRKHISRKPSQKAKENMSLYDNGLGLQSKEAIDLYQSIKHIREKSIFASSIAPDIDAIIPSTQSDILATLPSFPPSHLKLEAQSISPSYPISIHVSPQITDLSPHQVPAATPEDDVLLIQVTPPSASIYQIPSVIDATDKSIPLKGFVNTNIEEPEHSAKSAFQSIKETGIRSLESNDELKMKSPNLFQKPATTDPALFSSPPCKKTVSSFPAKVTPFVVQSPVSKLNPYIPSELGNIHHIHLSKSISTPPPPPPPPPPPLPPMNHDGPTSANVTRVSDLVESLQGHPKPSPVIGVKGLHMNYETFGGVGDSSQNADAANYYIEREFENVQNENFEVNLEENSEGEIASQVPLKKGDEDSVGFHYEVIVEFDYNASAATDLTAVTGDVLKVEKEDGEWIFCLNRSGAKGWIPKSFISVLQSLSVDDLRSPEDTMHTRIGSAEVMYDFEARNSDELTSLAGQVVLILAKPEDDWWLVEHSGKKGLLPSNFLEERSILLKGINDVEAVKDASLERNPFGSTVMLFSPSASEFPSINNDTENFSGSSEELSRKEAISEMVKTERSYVEDLLVVKTHFYAPMSKMNIDMLLLFSNILQIVEVNMAILKDFEEGESISTAYLKHLDNLQCYKMYCENLSGASTYLQKLRSSNPTLQTFLKSQQKVPACKNLDISSYLLIPMQRITRYALLLRQILHYTPKPHREYDSSMIALQMSEEFLDHINNAIKLRQSILNIDRIVKTVDLEIPSEHYRLDLKAQTRKMGSRIFLYEGVLLKSKSGRKLTAYLFNDLLLLVHLKGNGTKPYAMYKQPLMMDSLSVKDHSDSDSFQIDFEDQSIMVRALSISEKRQWINQIESARKVCRDLEAKKQNQSKLSNPSNIGTLSVLLCEARNCLDTLKTREVFALGRIKEQVLKSKVVNLSFQNAKFNQNLIFTLPTLDEVLQISLYRYNKYSADVYLGQAEIQLDILEYYAGKQTDEIELPLKDGGFKTLVIRIIHKR